MIWIESEAEMAALIRGILVVSFLAATAAAQAPAPPTPTKPYQKESSVKPGQPGTLDAAAISYGVKLQERASLALKKWSRNYARKKMRRSVVVFAAIRAAVDAQYPDASETARSAAAYFLLYTAYQDQYEDLAALEQNVLGVRRSEDSFRARNTMTGGGGSQRYGGATVNEKTGQLALAQGNSGGGSAYSFAENPYAAGEFFVPAPVDNPPVRNHVSGLRARLDAYGRLLSDAHKKMIGTPPDVLREIP